MANINWVIPDKGLTISLLGLLYLAKEIREKYGSYVFMLLFGLFRKNVIDVCSTMPWINLLLFGSLFCILLLVRKKLTNIFFFYTFEYFLCNF